MKQTQTHTLESGLHQNKRFLLGLEQHLQREMIVAEINKLKVTTTTTKKDKYNRNMDEK